MVHFELNDENKKIWKLLTLWSDHFWDFLFPVRLRSILYHLNKLWTILLIDLFLKKFFSKAVFISEIKLNICILYNCEHIKFFFLLFNYFWRTEWVSDSFENTIWTFWAIITFLRIILNWIEIFWKNHSELDLNLSIIWNIFRENFRAVLFF